MNLVKRVAATQKTVERFKGKTFHPGSADCVKLVIVHAKHMGRRISIPKYGSWKSAAATMRKLGFATLSEAMDHYFTRIEPHQVLAGDIIESLGSHNFSSLGICVGNGRALAFHEDVLFADIVQPLIVSGAWRIE